VSVKDDKETKKEGTGTSTNQLKSVILKEYLKNNRRFYR